MTVERKVNPVSPCKRSVPRSLSKLQVIARNVPFAAERSRGTNRQTVVKMTHWDMLNKENSNLVLCLTSPSASFAPQFGEPRDRSVAKGPF